ncbi:MAG: nicotinate-nucleotide adenylyltransferase [Clostridiaceae bacterium]|nr:nicotinate-nucleotide adenylyltransferase [Eubacteriales bacterium]
MRIGFLGGSFNPIHCGHIAIARQALQEFSLDKALLIVAAEPPHKEIAFHVKSEERFQMLERGLEGEQGLEASDIELKRAGKSYTYDTARLLRERCTNAELFCIVGADMLFDLPTWYRAEELLREVSFIGFARGGEARDVREAADALTRRYGARVFLSQTSGPELSSTEIRKRVYMGKSVCGMLPGAAERYLYEKGLYMPAEIRGMQEKLRRALNEERYAHTMGTVRAAAYLAERYGADPEKARLAALLHDCAKVKKEEMLAYLEYFGACPYGYAKRSPSILHGPIGAEVARADYGVTDPEVLLAIANHTACSEGMGVLEKVVYLADKIEPTRDYAGVEETRAAAEQSLDDGVLACMDYVLKFLTENKREIDPCIYCAREYIRKQNKR